MIFVCGQNLGRFFLLLIASVLSLRIFSVKFALTLTDLTRNIKRHNGLTVDHKEYSSSPLTFNLTADEDRSTQNCCACVIVHAHAHPRVFPRLLFKPGAHQLQRAPGFLK